MSVEKAHRWFSKRSLVLLALAIFVVGLVIVGGIAQGQSQQQQRPDGFPDLVSGLKAVPGCLGVETARTASGKNVIFAWFEGKEAVLRWYHSDMHQGVMNKFFPQREPRKPLQGVPDDVGPILAIASITLADKPQLEPTSLPISQISIELYKPITGGLFLGSRFAPASLKVSGMKDYTPKANK